MTGAELILKERESQTYTSEHDDSHKYEELLRAATSYIIADSKQELPPMIWPFENSAWQYKDKISQLIIAGAFIAAEIDRLKREEKNEVSTSIN